MHIKTIRTFYMLGKKGTKKNNLWRFFFSTMSERLIPTASLAVGTIALALAINAENVASNTLFNARDLSIENDGEVSLVAKGTSPNFELLGLEAGSGVTITSDTNNVTITVLGASGATGQTIPGPTGLIGASGNSGPVGASGPNVVGPTGASGVIGSTGASGQNGVVGASGASGISVTGPTGFTGQSTIGPTGASGQNAISAATGASGATGQVGASGAAGRSPSFALAFTSGVSTTSFGDRNVTLNTVVSISPANIVIYGGEAWCSIPAPDLSIVSVSTMAANGNFAVECPMDVTSFRMQAFMVFLASDSVSGAIIGIGLARTNSPVDFSSTFNFIDGAFLANVNSSTPVGTYFSVDQTFNAVIPAGALMVCFTSASAGTTPTSTQLFGSATFQFFG